MGMLGATGRALERAQSFYKNRQFLQLVYRCRTIARAPKRGLWPRVMDRCNPQMHPCRQPMICLWIWCTHCLATTYVTSSTPAEPPVNLSSLAPPYHLLPTFMFASSVSHWKDTSVTHYSSVFRSRNQEYWKPVPTGQTDTQLYHSSSRQGRDLIPDIVIFFDSWLFKVFIQPPDLPFDGYYQIF